ncbi:MAG TPA: hypothetical protein VFZ11_01480 [Gemmatimonadaceae bacterium]
MGERREPIDRARRVARMTFAIGTLLVVEAVVFGLAALPVVLLWRLVPRAPVARALWQPVALALALGPGYLVFAVLLMIFSALATRVLGWRTPRDAGLRIADLGWPLLRWVRGIAVSHVVRVFAGALLRATPLWTFYLRLGGARLGRRVYVNSLALTDYNLLEFGEGVVIGSDVHLSGHTVEDGVVRTGAVRLGRGVTIGVGSVIGIDVEIGAGAQVGALSLVAKHSRLAGGRTYVGVPARLLGADAATQDRGDAASAIVSRR